MITADAFKAALAQFAAGVTVVTTYNEDGEHFGMTASSFTSVSLDPSLVAVNVAKKAGIHDTLMSAGKFGVSIIGVDQAYIGEVFAGFHKDVEDRFSVCETITAETGCKLIPSALAYLDCNVWKAVDAGDHTIFIGEIMASGTTERRDPVMWYDRGWKKLVPAND